MMTNHTPEIEWLEAGNLRYMSGAGAAGSATTAERQRLATGQKPRAMIFGCVDSRVPPEYVFDADPGELLVIRTAGHVIDEAVLGSIQFGALTLEIPLLVVLGHTNCGAVTAAIEVANGAELPGSIDMVARAIQPAVRAVDSLEGDPVDSVAVENVRVTVNQLRNSALIGEAAAEKRLTIVGALYDIGSGRVAWVA